MNQKIKITYLSLLLIITNCNPIHASFHLLFERPTLGEEPETKLWSNHVKPLPKVTPQNSKLLKFLLQFDHYKQLHDDGLSAFTRENYKTSVMHPIPYRSTPFSRFSIRLETKNGVHTARKVYEKGDGIPRTYGHIYPYNYLKARLNYACLTAGYMRNHHHAHHVVHNFAEGVQIASQLCQFTLKPPYNTSYIESEHYVIFQQARSLLLFMKQEYNHNHKQEELNDKLFLTDDKVSYFNDIFKKRVKLLSLNLSLIAKENSLSEEAVLEAIEKRIKGYKISFHDDLLLLLSYNLLEFNPVEAEIVRKLNANK